jgi:hypothetical protein
MPGTKRKRSLFEKKAFIKPSIMERTGIKASELWKNLKKISKGKLCDKAVSKWTIKEKEAFTEELNHYSSIQMFDDSGDQGQVNKIMNDVDAYLAAGNDEEMREYLDPVYIILDWTQGPFQLPFPNLGQLAIQGNFPINVVPLANYIYIVNDERDGDYILGQLVVRFPGVRGYVMSTKVPIRIR